jgi:hypothetical protein
MMVVEVVVVEFVEKIDDDAVVDLEKMIDDCMDLELEIDGCTNLELIVDEHAACEKIVLKLLFC